MRSNSYTSRIAGSMAALGIGLSGGASYAGAPDPWESGEEDYLFEDKAPSRICEHSDILSNDYDLPSYSGKDQSFLEKIVQVGKVQSNVFPDNSNLRDSAKVPFLDAGDNFRNAVDYFGNGPDVAYHTEWGRTYIAKNDAHTAWNAISGSSLRNDNGSLKWGKVPYLGPVARWTLVEFPTGLSGTFTGFAGETGAGILNSLEGGFSGAFVELPKRSFRKDNFYTDTMDYTITNGNNATQFLSAMVAEHIFVGRESGKLFESTWNGITSGGKDWSVEYKGNFGRNNRNVILEIDDSFEEEVCGVEVHQKPNNWVYGLYRPLATAAVNAPWIWAAANAGGSSGSSSDGGGFNPGEGGPVGE